jgi:putative FmdB family regulatory protein
MPIYAYKCGSCGHAKDVLQKMSDTPLTVCPACGAAAFSKQLTAAGFQLKGSGWYATDFRNGSTPAPSAAPAADGAKPAVEAAKPATEGAKPAESAPAPKPAAPTAPGD